MYIGVLYRITCQFCSQTVQVAQRTHCQIINNNRDKCVTVRQKVLGSECILRLGNVSADRPIVQAEHLILVLKLVVLTQGLK